MIWKRLYKATSGSDHGTLYQLRNLVQRRNVGKEPKKDFNAHHDFFNVVLTSHIIVAAMEVFCMNNLEDEPCPALVPQNIDNMSKEEKKDVLKYLVGLIMDSYIDIDHCLLDNEAAGRSKSKNKVDDDSGETSKRISEEDDNNSEKSEEDHSNNVERNDSKEDDDNMERSESEEDYGNFETSKREGAQMNKCEDITETVKRKSEDDGIKMYAEDVLTLGLIYSEYSDAIKEGDGERVMRCWKFLMLLFKAAQRKNYACEAFNLLAQQKFILSPRLSKQLTWSRFINTRGGMGNNVPADLHMEHLNRVLKDGIKGLGANKTDRAITRLGKCINSIDDILNTFDEYHQVHCTSDYHTVPSLEKDIEMIVEELTKNVRPFSQSKGRSHKKVKISRHLMKTLDQTSFYSWMEDKWKNLLAGLL